MRHRYEVRFTRKVHLFGWYYLQFITAVLPFGKSCTFKSGKECLDFIDSHVLKYTDQVTSIVVSRMHPIGGTDDCRYTSDKVFDTEIGAEYFKDFSDFIKTT